MWGIPRENERKNTQKKAKIKMVSQVIYDYFFLCIKGMSRKRIQGFQSNTQITIISIYLFHNPR